MRGDGGGLALRCRSAGSGIKPPQGALAEDCRAERLGKRRNRIVSGVDRKDERWVNALCRLRCRKRLRWHQNQGQHHGLGMSLAGARLLARWCPAYRQHESGPGSRMEHVNARPDMAGECGRREGGLQAAESARSRVPMRARGRTLPSSCEASAYRSGGGAKGRGCPGLTDVINRKGGITWLSRSCQASRTRYPSS